MIFMTDCVPKCTSGDIDTTAFTQFIMHLQIEDSNIYKGIPVFYVHAFTEGAARM